MSYFEIIGNNTNYLHFQGKGISYSNIIGNNLFDNLSISLEDFIEKANKLLENHRIKVSDKFITYKIRNYKKLGKLEYNLGDDFLLCIGACILLEERQVNTSKILKKELFRNDSDIAHACSCSVIALHYQNKNCKVEIPFEKGNQYNPDLIINNLKCDVKTVQESDWTISLNPETRMTEDFDLCRDLTFDIGTFISNRSYKGIRQADVIFADLTNKSFGTLHNSKPNTKLGIPNPEKNRIIVFSMQYLNLNGFYINFQPELWNILKYLEYRYRRGILP